MFKNRTQVPLHGHSDSIHSETLPSPFPGIGADDRTSALGALRGVATMVGEIAATLERAGEFPGKLADARKLKHRLLLRAAGVEQRVLASRRELELARATGQQIVERRLKTHIRELEEERLDTAALLGEVDRVFQRLRRERRTLLYRIECGEALVGTIPMQARRDNVRALFEEARLRLAATVLESETGVEA
jgi:hypothetical protein